MALTKMRTDCPDAACFEGMEGLPEWCEKAIGMPISWNTIGKTAGSGTRKAIVSAFPFGDDVMLGLIDIRRGEAFYDDDEREIEYRLMSSIFPFSIDVSTRYDVSSWLACYGEGDDPLYEPDDGLPDLDETVPAIM